MKETPAQRLAREKKKKNARKPVSLRERGWRCKCRQLRLRLGLSLKEVAEQVGMSHTSYFFIEQGGDLRLWIAMKLSKFYGKPIDELWTSINEEDLFPAAGEEASGKTEEIPKN